MKLQLLIAAASAVLVTAAPVNQARSGKKEDPGHNKKVYDTFRNCLTKCWPIWDGVSATPFCFGSLCPNPTCKNDTCFKCADIQVCIDECMAESGVLRPGDYSNIDGGSIEGVIAGKVDGSIHDNLAVTTVTQDLEARDKDDESDFEIFDGNQEVSVRFNALMGTIMLYGTVYEKINSTHIEVDRPGYPQPIGDFVDTYLQAWLYGLKNAEKRADADLSRAWVNELYDHVAEHKEATGRYWARRLEIVFRKDIQKTTKKLIKDLPEPQKVVVKASIKQAWYEEFPLPVVEPQAAVAGEAKVQS